MRCSRVNAAIVRRQLDLLSAADRRELDDHLESCTVCGIEAVIEQRITADLGALQAEYPAEIDVTARVMARVEELGALSREEVPDRQLAWGSLAAAAAAIGLLAGAVKIAPAIPTVARVAATLIGAAFTALVGFLKPALTLVAVPFRLLGSLLESVGALDLLGGALGPAGHVAALLCCLLVLSTTTFVIRRDFARLATDPETRGTAP